MKRFLLLLTSCVLAIPGRTQTLFLYDNIAEENTEEVTYDASGEVSQYRKVNIPTLTVSLPEPGKADGSAILIFPGGALVSLTWDTEFRQIASWLNERGVAAIGVKYRLRSGFPAMPRRESLSQGQPNVFQRMQGRIYDYAELRNANTSPSAQDPTDKSLDNAAEDALRAMALVKAHATEWGINPDRLGWMGFSAGGGVALAALMKALPDEMPAYLCSVYGPSLIDIAVPGNAPKLYIAVHADHPNVAAGCMALFMEWKKAGADAEIHVYDAVTGGFFGGMGQNAEQRPTPEGYWLQSLYSWMSAHGFAGRS